MYYLVVISGHAVRGPKYPQKRKVGSSFDGFLAEQGILEECEEQAIKQILADQIKAATEKDPSHVLTNSPNPD